jgi:HSP20 family protein
MRSLMRQRPMVANWGLMDLRDEIEKMFHDFGAGGETGEGFWTPSVDISEEPDKLIMAAELPGVDKKDVKISLHENVLTIEGQKSRQTEEQKDKYYRCERSYGRFSRSFTLPTHVVADKIDANYKDGILTVTLPKVEEAQPRQIQIK